MQGWNEKVYKSIQRIQKNRLVQWFYNKDTSTQYRILFAILASVIVIWNIVNIYFNSFKIDDVSARYLLSALVQSLAAIIAIVVTLTLVAVQLTASVYSPRVIDIFKEDKVMWWLLVWYGLSIFSGLFVLEMIGGTYSNSWCIIVPLEILVLLVYLMGISAFIGLFWHIGNMIDLLKPENIIKRLADKITKDRIPNLKEDPIQPMMDIIHGSVMKYDIATTRVGLKTVTGQVIKIIDSDSQEKISKSFCSHFNLVSKLTVRNTDEESTGEVIVNLGRFGKSATENGLKDAALKVLDSLGDIGEIVAEKGFDDATSKVAESLKDVGTFAAEKESGFEDVATKVAVSLGTVGRITAKKELESAISQVVESLSSVGSSAAKKKLYDTMFYVALSLGDVGISAAEKGSEFEYIVIQVAMHLQRVCPYEYKNENVLLRVASSLGNIGASAAENRLNDATSEVVRSLGFIGAEGEGFEHVVRCAAVSLVSVGTTAIGKEELEPATLEAVRSLAELTTSSEEIVKNTIQELKQEEPDRDAFQKYMEPYERPIRQDRDSFQKFINRYEQRLEELRELQTRKSN
ncbi:MAG: DUF2254 family protein [Euryarchaeota archaeon]|nr:DUF2254 family protein [Euryarchaeota archaeon]